MSAILLGIHYEELYSFQEASKINKSLEFENKPDFCCLENAFQNPGPKCNITALSLKTMNFFPLHVFTLQGYILYHWLV